MPPISSGLTSFNVEASVPAAPRDVKVVSAMKEHEKSRTVGAGIATGLIGFAIGGPVFAAAIGLGTVYCTKQSGTSGDVARAIGDIALSARNKALEVNDKHCVVDRSKEVAIGAWEKAKDEIYREEGAVKKVKHVALLSFNAVIQAVQGIKTKVTTSDESPRSKNSNPCNNNTNDIFFDDPRDVCFVTLEAKDCQQENNGSVDSSTKPNHNVITASRDGNISRGMDEFSNNNCDRECLTNDVISGSENGAGHEISGSSSNLPPSRDRIVSEGPQTAITAPVAAIPPPILPTSLHSPSPSSTVTSSATSNLRSTLPIAPSSHLPPIMPPSSHLPPIMPPSSHLSSEEEDDLIAPTLY